MNGIEFATKMAEMAELFEQMFASVDRLDKVKASKMSQSYFELMNDLSAGFCCIITSTKAK